MENKKIDFEKIKEEITKLKKEKENIISNIERMSKIEKYASMINDNTISFDDFYTHLRDLEEGDWDSINNEDIIKQYVYEMSLKGISVSHILEALETNESSQDLYRIWLGNSMETPEPINNKLDLFEALGLGEC